MFFCGHSKTPEFYAPRYEFVYYDNKEQVRQNVSNILSALRLASFDIDDEHLWGLEEPVSTIVPTPLLIAHDLSKKMGEELVLDWVAKVNAEYIRLKKQHISFGM